MGICRIQPPPAPVGGELAVAIPTCNIESNWDIFGHLFRIQRYGKPDRAWLRKQLSGSGLVLKKIERGSFVV